MAAYTTIDDPEAQFQTVIYTGNGSADNAITLPGTTAMQPDFVWIKNRDATDSHCVFDAVRGATEVLHPNVTTAEATDADTLDAFQSDGFKVDADVKVNTNAEDYVAWCWKAGTTAVPSGGSITPTACSFSAAAGFGIYAHAGNSTAGATIAHGLGATPAFMMSRRRNHTGGWAIYHHKNTAAPETDFLLLNATQVTYDESSVWNDTAPTSTLFTIGNDGTVNGAYNYVKYIWTETQGFSKFGSYLGNGNNDGPFVYTGFKPAFVVVKPASFDNSWLLFDRHRPGHNVIDTRLEADGNGAEVTGTLTFIDFLSNGFKIRTSNGHPNPSGGTLVWAAWAYAPFVNSEGVPCNAR